MKTHPYMIQQYKYALKTHQPPPFHNRTHTSTPTTLKYQRSQPDPVSKSRFTHHPYFCGCEYSHPLFDSPHIVGPAPRAFRVTFIKLERTTTLIKTVTSAFSKSSLDPQNHGHIYRINFTPLYYYTHYNVFCAFKVVCGIGNKLFYRPYPHEAV